VLVEVTMSDALLTARQVADRLNVRPATIYAAAETGKLPCVRLWRGARRSLIRFRREDIEHLICEKSTIVDSRRSR
jgi:excisionase family DNA binding protein